MKVHYINILLFTLPLNILEHNQRNHKKTILRTPKTKPTRTHRTLCECKLYAPSNYENDPDMKELMENFNRQTSERFRQYDEKIQDKRKQCKEKCEKDIQKIILKDKIEKELTENIGALQTDIRTEDIPTCVCEKSIADKTEKVCVNCGKTMGAVAPAWGLVSGLGYAAWMNYVAGFAAKAATNAGVKEAIKGLGNIYFLNEFSYIDLATKVTATNFDKTVELIQIVNGVSNMCGKSGLADDTAFCMAKEVISKKPGMLFARTISQKTAKVAADAGQAAKTAAANETAKFATNTIILTNTIISSIVAIVVIVLVMVIIYLILRYLRKSKMKKKLHYIKLLKE
ncbi:rifin [Plasmodium falciparum NF54]|uniref:Rifin n=2 Tax=Plasmodium falciparum TaxID=5833 RepID=C0H5N6_PLAF7|nr:rifin [Plasmodium falciparum 3D7]EWC86382.1 hypothetical protein PFNF54_04821 [Plasmodium falciparum NF54]KAF4326481.1 rifin [Plasmodium falciparum NF54]PKC44591.1 rifin [Plasmodium falciparum NF54]CAX64417.1 rifin [Plasmodium falciparum 3D7]|eukprot:XP_002809133.1 rifin [Plasmodium falciparum 3D7]